MSASDELARHEQRGHYFTAEGVRSFALDDGEGPPVLCLHGVPVSSYLYRRVVPELAARGLRGVAVDLPGLGLAERPTDFDYTWSGLGRWLVEAVDALGLDRFHLVVHDIGGPVGFELATAMPDRVASLTVLNTLVDADTFRRPWSMAPLAMRGVGPVWVRSLNRPAFRWLMRRQGIADVRAVTDDELDAHLALVRRGDGGRALLRIMRGFERTTAKRDRYRAAVGSEAYPVQVIWGAQDPALRIDRHGETVRRAAGLDAIIRVPAKHFLQEDQAPAIAEHVARFAAGQS